MKKHDPASPEYAAGNNGDTVAAPPWLTWGTPALFALACLMLSCWLHLRASGVNDLDALYHFRHAQLYTAAGPRLREFPWAQFSVIRVYAADIWYGFHLLLTPFTHIANPWGGIKTASITLLMTMLCCLYAAFQRLKVRWPWLWPFVILLISDDLLWRLLALRPHVLSLGLVTLIFAVTLRGRTWQVGVCSFASAWVHTTTAWLPPLIVLPLTLCLFLTEKAPDSRGSGSGDESRLSSGGAPLHKVAAMLLAVAAAVMLRPGPIGGLHLLYVQLVEWSRLKQLGVPLLVGAELLPVPADSLIKSYIPFILLWGGAAVVFLYTLLKRRSVIAALSPVEKLQLWASLLFSLLFYQLAMSVARRSVEQWIAFGSVFIASVVTLLVPRIVSATVAARRGGALALFLLLLLIAFGVTIRQNAASNETRDSQSIYSLEEESLWLGTHAPQGTVVFHAYWDWFAPLFFWNPNQNYIGGMDPVFQYSYDPALYWKAYYLARGVAGRFTSGSPPGPDGLPSGAPEETYTVLTRDYHASYLLVVKQVETTLYKYVQSDPRFVLCHEGPDAAIYQFRKP